MFTAQAPIVERLSHSAERAASARMILIVEDEILIRLDAAEIFIEAGFHVITVGNADEALEVLLLLAPIDLVFTDIRMPGTIDGLDLAHRVRLDWPHIKIVITSGHLNPTAFVPHGFFAKPYSPSDVVDCISRLLADGQS